MTIRHRRFPRARILCALILAFAGTGAQAGTGFDNYVSSIALQPDGKFLVGGSFTSVGGLSRLSLARLYSDGRVDAAFAPPLPSGSRVDCLLLLGDGSLLIGGYFQFSGAPLPPAKYLLHVNADGSLASNPLQPDGSPSKLVLQADGKILVGSGFTAAGLHAHNNIGRLNADFTIDDAFAPDVPSDSNVYSIAVQSDGHVLIGGTFAQMDSVVVKGVARVDSTGVLDTSFVWPATYNGTPYIYQVIPLPSGKVLVGGGYGLPGYANTIDLSRLNSDATLDTTFTPLDSAGDQVVVPLANGQILDGGLFNSLGTYPNYISRNNIGRINGDGSPDASFVASTDSGPGGVVGQIVVQPDGRIVIGGAFSQVDGQPRPHMARLNNDGTLDNSFQVDDTVFANGFE